MLRQCHGVHGEHLQKTHEHDPLKHATLRPLIEYDTIRDAILTCARKPTRVSLTAYATRSCSFYPLDCASAY